MPTYTYRCQKCSHEFERLQSMSDAPVKRCPECKSKVQRVIHPVGIVLKGSGFHRNDYRKKDSSTESKGESKSETESKGESKSETKSEPSGSKPAEKKTESKKSEKKGD